MTHKLTILLFMTARSKYLALTFIAIMLCSTPLQAEIDKKDQRLLMHMRVIQHSMIDTQGGILSAEALIKRKKPWAVNVRERLEAELDRLDKEYLELESQLCDTHSN